MDEKMVVMGWREKSFNEDVNEEVKKVVNEEGVVEVCV